MATIHDVLATALEHHQAGRVQDAEQLYREILAIEPNHVEALHHLGVIAYQQGNCVLATDVIRQALELKPDYAEAQNNLGIALSFQGKSSEAIACFRRAVELKPDWAKPYLNWGKVLAYQGQFEEAATYFQHVLRLEPDSTVAMNNLGVALNKQGKHEQAIACYCRVLELNSDDPDAYNNYGNALMDQRRYDEAIANYRRAVELKPDWSDAYNNLGGALTSHEKLEEAVACFKRALELDPEYHSLWNNLGVALKNQGKLEEATECCRRAVELKPDYAAAYCNLGEIYHEQRNLEEATTYYRRALELKPDMAEAHVGQATVMLLVGDFRRGWAEYEWRWKGKLQPRDFYQPRWNGEPLDEKTILLHAEQGFGDTIQFIRYAPIIKSLGGTVLVECPKRVVNLIGTCPGIDRVVGDGDLLPVFDVHAPLLSLPAILNTVLNSIPSTVPYLFADSHLVAQWRARLDNLHGFRIGINWRGRAGEGLFRQRDIPLECFAPLAQVTGVQLISLQKGIEQEALAANNNRFPIAELGEFDTAHGAFIDTAAIMINLDLIITSDTSVAHLAGALGVPVWTVLPFAGDWRWLLDRWDSPWYPTMRLFRQRCRGDWVGIFDEIQRTLRERLYE